jgi:hypothetical protein
MNRGCRRPSEGAARRVHHGHCSVETSGSTPPTRRISGSSLLKIIGELCAWGEQEQERRTRPV